MQVQIEPFRLISFRCLMLNGLEQLPLYRSLTFCFLRAIKFGSGSAATSTLISNGQLVALGSRTLVSPSDAHHGTPVFEGLMHARVQQNALTATSQLIRLLPRTA